MSRLGKRSRRAAVLGAAGLGACAVLAACAPVQMGAAAIVGNQRITVSTVDTQVSNLKTAVKPYGSAVTLTAADMPNAVLSWLIRFQVMDQLAADNGITVTKAQAQAGLSALSSLATQNGYSSTKELLVANGIPPQLFPQMGRWSAQETAYATKENGGTPPSTSAQQSAFNAAFTKAQCSAEKTLTIKVSPQFGRLDYTKLAVVSVPNTLSQPAGTPTPASTEGLTPAC